MKKGFTLAEMLAVIVVLSIVMVLSIRSINAVRSAQLKKITDDKINNIAKAAILYAQEHPSIFMDNSKKCSNSTFNETNTPDITHYKNSYTDCAIVTGTQLANDNYLETDGGVLKNDLNGADMLLYNVILYRDNNRINSYVAVTESTKIREESQYILVQQAADEGGMYSSCSTNRKKVLVDGVYRCGSKQDKMSSTTITNSDGSTKKQCSLANYKLVDGNSSYCCKEDTVYISGECYSTTDLTEPTCPTGSVLSDTRNLCIINSTIVESTCPANYNKRQFEGRYLCISNSNSFMKIAPSCGSGKNLSDDQNYCEDGTLQLSTCSSSYTKIFVNNIYQCVSNSNYDTRVNPSCDSGKHLVFHQLYCSN